MIDAVILNDMLYFLERFRTDARRLSFAHDKLNSAYFIYLMIFLVFY